MRRIGGALLAILVTPLLAQACPFCEGQAGQNLVKEEIFTEHFRYYAFATVWPFVACLAIILWLSRDASPPTKNTLTQNPTS